MGKDARCFSRRHNDERQGGDGERVLYLSPGQGNVVQRGAGGVVHVADPATSSSTRVVRVRQRPAEKGSSSWTHQCEKVRERSVCIKPTHCGWVSAAASIISSRVCDIETRARSLCGRKGAVAN